MRPTVAPTPFSLTFEELEAVAEVVEYDELVANGIDWLGVAIYFRGQVAWVTPAEPQGAILGIEVGSGHDTVYVRYTGTDVFHELERVEFVSEYSGLYDYESVGGKRVTLPAFQSVEQGQIREAAIVDVPTTPCTDRAHKAPGYRWLETYDWSFQVSSTPAQLDVAAVLDVLERSLTNITDARNDCGLPDQVSASAAYQGETDREPEIGPRGRCTGTDGRSVIGFGRLPPDTLGVTCTQFAGNVIDEADVVFNEDIDWALAADECVFGDLLEAVATHEFGHVFGLEHVREETHGEMTMSPLINGPCDAEVISLGLGDVLGLEELY